jgi:hypothetical protein
LNYVNRFVWLVTVICTLLFAFSQRTSAASHSQHCNDWKACLGIAEVDQQKFCESMSKFSTQIDTVNEVQAKLRRDYNLFVKHRLLFHWGFNDDPQKSKALTKKIDDAKPKLPPEKRDALFKYLKFEQQQRNGKMILQIEEITKVPKGQSRALATILYDIHILRDYDTIDVDPLQEISRVNSDLKEKGILRMEFKTGEEQFLEALDKAEKSGQSDSQKAQNIIQTIKDNLPRLLSKQWHGSFPSGIRLTEQETKHAKGK